MNRDEFIKFYAQLEYLERFEILFYYPGVGQTAWIDAYREISQNSPLSEGILGKINENKLNELRTVAPISAQQEEFPMGRAKSLQPGGGVGGKNKKGGLRDTSIRKITGKTR